MPYLDFSPRANIDLARLADFYTSIDPSIGRRAIKAILDSIDLLETFPLMTEASQEPEYIGMHELHVPFGEAGYLVLYEFDEVNDVVIIAGIKHTRENGYK